MPQIQEKKRRHGFQSYALHEPAQPSYPALQYLRTKSSFWIAALSLVAFVGGNMMGQHGWHAFWKAVLGAYNDTLIVYDGIIAPIENVPGPEWMGDSRLNTFRQVPEKHLVALPRYSLIDSSNDTKDAIFAKRIYSVAHAGDYRTGKRLSGSHNGVDISTPDGTPLRVPANGRIITVSDEPSGFGMHIVVKLPNVPDPKNPKKTTDLYCTFGHLSGQLVASGDIVQKGKVIGFTGHTGFASGPHLHFQCDDATSSGSPIWAFTSAELREAGLTFTEGINSAFHQERLLEHSIDPMAYVEAQHPPVNPGTTVVQAESPDRPGNSSSPQESVRIIGREERIVRRLSQRKITQGRTLAVREGGPLVSIAALVPLPAPEPDPEAKPLRYASSIELQVPESFRGREWLTMTVIARDTDGNRIAHPVLSKDILLRVAYGVADIRPAVISALDFQDGAAAVRFLPRGTRTVVLEVASPYSAMSKPVRYDP